MSRTATDLDTISALRVVMAEADCASAAALRPALRALRDAALRQRLGQVVTDADADCMGISRSSMYTLDADGRVVEIAAEIARLAAIAYPA